MIFPSPIRSRPVLRRQSGFRAAPEIRFLVRHCSKRTRRYDQFQILEAATLGDTALDIRLILDWNLGS